MRLSGIGKSEWIGGLVLALVVGGAAYRWRGAFRSPGSSDFGRRLLLLHGPDARLRLVIAEQWMHTERLWITDVPSFALRACIEPTQAESFSTVVGVVVRDCDGDGWSDFGATRWSGTRQSNSGCRVVVLSSATGREVWSSEPTDGSTAALAFVDDLDGDGLPEFIRPYVVAGTDADCGLNLIESRSGAARSSRVTGPGRNLQSIPDANADGRADVLVTTETNQLLLSGADLGVIQTLPLRLPAPHDSPLPHGGRLNAAAVFELAGGLVRVGYFETSETSAVECRSVADDTVRWTTALPGSNSTDSAVVARGGDVDGDGTADVVLGWPLFFEDSVRILSGADGRLLRTDRPGKGDPGSSHFGTDVVALPDVDGDGVDDYAASDVQQGNDNPGRVNIVSGRTGVFIRSLCSTDL